jgi:hypothetical protein
MKYGWYIISKTGPVIRINILNLVAVPSSQEASILPCFFLQDPLQKKSQAATDFITCTR